MILASDNCRGSWNLLSMNFLALVGHCMACSLRAGLQLLCFNGIPSLCIAEACFLLEPREDYWGVTGIFNDAVTLKLRSGISSRLNLEVHASAMKSSSRGEYCGDDD